MKLYITSYTQGHEFTENREICIQKSIQLKKLSLVYLIYFTSGVLKGSSLLTCLPMHASNIWGLREGHANFSVIMFKSDKSFLGRLISDVKCIQEQLCNSSKLHKRLLFSVSYYMF